MRFGSLFAGIGGFDLGFERAGMAPAFQVEIDAKCRAVLSARFPGVPQYTDVKEFDGTVHPVDVLCGGFPCQDLSVAGRRAGLGGARSGLFFEVARILDEAQPEWVVLENVPGLLSSQRGRDMGVVLGTLADLGYVGAWRVLDAQYFGVAQRRRRVFLVGRLGADGAAEVLLEPEGVRRDSPPSRETGTAVAALTANGVGTCGADDNQGQAGHLIPTHEVSPCLQERGAKGVDSDMTQAHDVRLAYGLSENQRAEVRLTEIHRQLTCGGGKAGQGYPATFIPSLGVRRLTPTECERLQGFPDGWTDGQADSARYRQLGNAVCVPVAEWLGRRLAAVAGV